MRDSGFYARHFSEPRQERAFLSAVGFTSAFAVARGITHAIRAGVGPFQKISAGTTAGTSRAASRSTAWRSSAAC